MKKGLLSLIILCLISIYAWGEERFEQDDVFLSWSVEADRLILVLKAPTTGWISIGIGGEQGMEGTNILFLWVDDLMGIAMGEDHYGDSANSHARDLDLGGSQDVLVLSGKQSQTETEVTCVIPLDSGDEYDTLLESGKIYRMVLAYGESDSPEAVHTKTISTEISIP